jgi:hypothetical protein
MDSHIRLRTMRKIVLSCFITLIACFTSACTQNKSAEYYLLHPREILSAYQRCSQLDPLFQSPECRVLIKVIPVFKNYLAEVINNPNQFGLEIMRAQYRCVQLQKSLLLAKKEAKNKTLISVLSNQIREINLDIKARYAVMRLFFQLNVNR